MPGSRSGGRSSSSTPSSGRTRSSGTAPPAVIEVTESLQAERRYINMNHLQIALATALIAAMCALTAMGLGYWFVGRPMALLRDKARAVGEGRFGARLALRQHDELGEFAEEL